MHKYAVVVHDIFATNSQGDPNLSFQYAYQYVRWEEILYSMQWLYDHFPQGKQKSRG